MRPRTATSVRGRGRAAPQERWTDTCQDRLAGQPPPSVKTGVHAALRCERIPSGGRTVIVILPAAARPPAGVPTAVKYPDDDEMPLT